MTTTQDPIAHAARLRRETAEELRQAHSAAPAIGDELRDRLVAISKAIADQDDRTAQAMLREILAAPQPAPLTAAAGQRRSDLVPGVMHCAKCKFQLNRITLCVSDGNAYAGNNETEPCPNGCGPLWPVTWEQEARNCWKALEEMHERLHPAPTPPAEQQAQPGAVYAELPQPDSWFHFTAQFWENKLRDFADRTHALRMQAAPKAVPGEPVHGDVLPPVGSRVYIRHGRDNGAHACTVTGYYAWGDLGGDKRLHRVFVRLVYEGTDTQQARMLCDCHPTAEAALSEAAPQQEAQEPAFWMDEKGHTWSHSDWKQFPKYRAKYPIPLYAHRPPPQPAPDCHHRPPCDECAHDIKAKEAGNAE